MEKSELKGAEGGNCNRTACQQPGAYYEHKDLHKFYCKKCAMAINKECDNFGEERCFPDVPAHSMTNYWAACIVASMLLFSAPAQAAQDCTDTGMIFQKNYYVSNNVWNREWFKGTQCITENGWEWKWPSTNKVRSYPSIVAGHKPWDKQVVRTGFTPKKIKDINSLSLTLKYETSAKGKYNAAVDIWVTDAAKPTDKNIKAEIMIWTDNNGMSGGRAEVDRVTIDGIEYGLHMGPFPKWKYIAFIPKKKSYNVKLDIKKFLDVLIERKALNTENYIADIEFGNEIMGGSGKTTVHTFYIEE